MTPDAGDNEDSVKRAIAESVLTSYDDGPDGHDRPEFNLARKLKAVPALANAPLGALWQFHENWHVLSAKRMNGKPLDDSRHDFGRAWKNVKYPAGCGPMELAMKRAKTSGPPPEAVALKCGPEVGLLAALSREMQRNAGGEPFFLSCRTAARLLGIPQRYKQVSRWLQLLVMLGLLEEVRKGSAKTGEATRYRYCGEVSPAPAGEREPRERPDSGAREAVVE